MSGKREFQMIQIHPFKEKEGGERGSKLGCQWKEKEKVPMLGGQCKEKEKVPMLGGQWKEKEKFLFTFSHSPPQQILLKPSFFPLILSFYFTMVLGHHLRISSLFF
jgi:hypothetical protein